MITPPAPDSVAALIDSLRHVIASMAAAGDTLPVKVVTTPRSHWAETWHILGQLGAAGLTVVVAVVVFVLTQALAKLAIEPSIELRRVIGRIAHALVFYANVHANVGDRPVEIMDEAHRVYRDLSSELRAAAANIPPWARRPMAWLRVIPAWEDMRWSAQNLIGLSNSIHASPLPDQSLRNWELADQIRSRLGSAPFG